MLPLANAAGIRAFHISCARSSTRPGWRPGTPPTERQERLEAGAPRIGDPQVTELAAAARLASSVARSASAVRRAPQERVSGVGELHLAGGADEEIDPEVALELSDRGAERRLGHVQLRGAAEVQLLRHGDEVPQVAQLDHARSQPTPLHTCSVSG